MPQSVSVFDERQRRVFKKMIVVSVIVHLVIITVGHFTTKGSKHRLIYSPMYTTVELVGEPGRTRKRRGKKKRSKAVITSKSKKKKTKKSRKKADVVLPSGNKKNKKAVAATLAKLSKRLEQREREDDLDDKMQELENLANERERASRELASLRDELRTGKGTGTGRGGGVSTGASDIMFKQYYNRLYDMIQSEWITPSKDKKDFQTVLQLRIDPASGALKDVRIEKKSGSTLFDNTAIRAIKKAAPFPAPPQGVELERGLFAVGFRFNSEGIVR